MPTAARSFPLPACLREHPGAAAIASIVEAALAAVAPHACLDRHLRVDDDSLWVDGHAIAWPGRGRVRVFGAGKASVGLTRALLDRVGARIRDGLVIAKHEASTDLGPVRLRTAGHPLPDARSLAATRELLAALAQHANADDLVLCPISGGASALLTAPRVDLEALRERTRRALAGGESIESLNAWRRDHDAVKAGGLARAAAPARVLGLVLSDVVGDSLPSIGSGPTVLEPADARVVNVVIGGNADARAGAATRARALGFAVAEHGDPLVGEARHVGAAWARVLAGAGDMLPLARPAVLIGGGETTVYVRGSGRGGRNQELALAALPGLASARDLVLVAFGTDGEDGPTPAAGAVVTGASARRAAGLGLDPANALDRNDAHGLFRAMDDLLVTGPTGTNVGDLVLGFVF